MGRGYADELPTAGTHLICFWTLTIPNGRYVDHASCRMDIWSSGADTRHLFRCKPRVESLLRVTCMI